MQEWDSLDNIILSGQGITLRPLLEEDYDAACEAALHSNIWDYFVLPMNSKGDVKAFVESAISTTRSQQQIVFGIFDERSGKMAGSMSYGNLDKLNKRLEIGWSWLSPPFQGTYVNSEAKRLLLDFAFDRLQCERVEFKTDILNQQARKGLLSIGATEEGVLRSFNYMPSGRRRDVIYYSILRDEWPDRREKLMQRAAQKYQ